MIRVGKESNLVPSEVIARAVEFFGASGLGMTVVDQSECYARFEGGGGHVAVEAGDIDGQKGSDVNVEGREWDYQIKQFLGKI
jgi:hypothetical protein